MASQYVNLPISSAATTLLSANNTWTGVNTYNNDIVVNSELYVGSTAEFVVDGTSNFNGNSYFNGATTEANTFTVLPQGTATALVNYASNAFNLDSSYWTGTVAAFDSWVWQTVVGTGANPYSIMNLAHSGTPGLVTVYMPALDNTPIGLINQSPIACTTLQSTVIVTLHVQGAGITPTPQAAGSIALTSTFILAVFNGSSWVKASDGTTPVTF